MGTLLATLFCAYTIAKVLRDSLFLEEFGAVALPYGYIAVAVGAAVFVWLESFVAGRFTRVGATRFTQYAAIGFSVLAAAVYPSARHWTIAGFYVWTGSQAIMILPHFWALALDVWDSRRARRVFPLFAGCALIGGLVGGALAAWATPILKHVGLMWMLSGFLITASVLTRIVERHRARRPESVESTSKESNWTIVRRSPYIKVLAVGFALSVVVSALVDFQFKYFIQGVYPDRNTLTPFLGKFYIGLNLLSLLFQFSVAGWVLQRLGLGLSTALQPVTAMLFASFMLFGPIWWAIVGMRWIQGVVTQTLGKASAEIHYAAIHPRERRRIKPAIDTLVDRWSDAAAGVLLLLLIHTAGVRLAIVSIVTGVLAIAWLAANLLLERKYGRAFEQSLSSRWIEPEATPEAVRTPSARRSLREALRADDERRLVFALKLSQVTRDSGIAGAVRRCLRHASPAVRAAAIEAMQAMRLPDPEGTIAGFLREPDEGPRRAAVGYLLSRGPDRSAFARRLLDGDDIALQHYVLDALSDGSYDALDVLTPQWIDAHVKSDAIEERLLAARAAGAMPRRDAVRWLRSLLTDSDVEVRRVALNSAKLRPSRDLLDGLVPLFVEPELSRETREAVAAIGDPAVPELERLLGGDRGARAQALAARTLGRIATRRAIDALYRLVRTTDPSLRRLGLQSLNRVRIESGEPVLSRSTAHKLFLRELADYQAHVEPAVRLQANPAPEVRLLAASFRESAETALERALRALACWYEFKPLAGAFSHLRTGSPQDAAPALEYLGHVLPRAIFRPITRIFEERPVEDEHEDAGAGRDEVADPIRSAWRWGDAWLRACAVRASRCAPSLDPHLFATGEQDEPLVRAELAALSAAAPRRPDPARQAVGTASLEGGAC